MMVSFMVLMFAELYLSPKNIEVTINDISQVRFDHKLVTAVSVIIFMYNVQFLVFEAFNELKNKSNSRFSRSSVGSVVIESIFYLSIGFMGILMFGPGEIKDDFLKNLAERPGAVSIAMRFLFCILILLDTPYMYMATKEQGLVIHDEIVNSSVSRRVERIK